MRIFENPSNGHRETIAAGAPVLAFLFGCIYLAIKGVWSHVFIWLAIVILPSIGLGPGYTIFAMLILSVVYAFNIDTILANRYLTAGWREISTQEKQAATSDVKPIISVGQYEESAPEMRSTAAEINPIDTKTCPQCAETIKAAAIKCRYCGSELSA